MRKMKVSFKTHIVFQYQRKDKNYPVSIRIGWMEYPRINKSCFSGY